MSATHRAIISLLAHIHDAITALHQRAWDAPDAVACRRLVETGLSGIGFDGPSADPVDTTTFDLHKIWLGAGRLIIENMTNLGELPERVQVVVAPMKVKDANGAPARIFAFIPGQEDT